MVYIFTGRSKLLYCSCDCTGSRCVGVLSRSFVYMRVGVHSWVMHCVLRSFCACDRACIEQGQPGHTHSKDGPVTTEGRRNKNSHSLHIH